MRNGSAAIWDAAFGGSGRSLPNSDNIRAIQQIWPVTSSTLASLHLSKNGLMRDTIFTNTTQILRDNQYPQCIWSWSSSPRPPDRDRAKCVLHKMGLMSKLPKWCFTRPSFDTNLSVLHHKHYPDLIVTLSVLTKNPFLQSIRGTEDKPKMWKQCRNKWLFLSLSVLQTPAMKTAQRSQPHELFMLITNLKWWQSLSYQWIITYSD